MDIFVYSDESGVFDNIHNDVFIYGGLIFLNKSDKDIYCRRYIHAENTIRKARRYSGGYGKENELKACLIDNKEKSKLFRSLNQCIKFGVIVNQQKILKSIYNDKKTKQRYLDYAYKIGLKRAFQSLIEKEIIKPNESHNIHIFADEHSTATDGRYELREALEQEFKLGTYNYDYNIYYQPIFKNLKGIDLHSADSKGITLVRAADIVANRLYYCSVNNKNMSEIKNLIVTYLP